MVPSILIFVFYGLAFAGLTVALKKIEVGVAYAVWSGVGTAIVTIIGFMYFKKSVTLLKLASITFIIIGVLGLNLSSMGR